MGIFNLFSNNEIIYFPGCYSLAFARGKISNYEKILKKLGINFRTTDKTLCCSGILNELGYDKESRKLARENFNFLKEKGTKKIIVSCPLCYYTFSNSYQKMLPDWDLEIEHILETILNELKRNKRFFHYFAETLTYYDSCYMARYSKITEAPREILKMLGFKIQEIFIPIKEGLCCGSCGGLAETNPNLANRIAINFIKFLRRKGIKKMIISDHKVLKHLRENLYKIKEDIEVVDISDVICDALILKKNKENWE